MTPKDKDYIDRQNYQFRNDLNELQNRIIALEGKSVANADGAVHIELDRAELYAQLLRAVHNCLEQREAKLREEDRQRIEQLRAEAEAKGETFYATTHEWQTAMANSMDNFYNTMLGLVEIVDKRYKHILVALANAGLATADNPVTTEGLPLFSNLPSGTLPACREICNRIKHRIHHWLTAKFHFHRGYTIFAIFLYLALFALLSIFHISVKIT